MIHNNALIYLLFLFLVLISSVNKKLFRQFEPKKGIRIQCGLRTLIPYEGLFLKSIKYLGWLSI